jgi:hypothetical protein
LAFGQVNVKLELVCAGDVPKNKSRILLSSPSLRATKIFFTSSSTFFVCGIHEPTKMVRRDSDERRSNKYCTLRNIVLIRNVWVIPNPVGYVAGYNVKK